MNITEWTVLISVKQHRRVTSVDCSCTFRLRKFTSWNAISKEAHICGFSMRCRARTLHTTLWEIIICSPPICCSAAVIVATIFSRSKLIFYASEPRRFYRCQNERWLYWRDQSSLSGSKAIFNSLYIGQNPKTAGIYNNTLHATASSPWM